MSKIDDHPLRYQLANELHARPFPALTAPCRAAYIAIKRPENAAARDREADRNHLLAFLDRFGAQHPQPGATHFFGEVGKHRLKWENHSEFVTYTLFSDGVSDPAFDGELFRIFPEDWLLEAPGVRMTSALIRLETWDGDDAKIDAKVDNFFVPESVAVSRVIDGKAVIAGDFRIDSQGHMRMAIFAQRDAGSRRVGRVMQRLCEIETYKTMSMLGFARARDLSAPLGGADAELTHLIEQMAASGAAPDHTLQSLLRVSANLEKILAQSAFRFSATDAYETLVHERIKVLREERFDGRQTFGEFMMRRFDPAMRTVRATKDRLHMLAERASQAGNLLRTRVDVDRSAQNQKLLESMDQRADLQLRLQKTVEGLSVVAISYYAVNLATYALGPFGREVGVSGIVLTAILTPLVVFGVWWVVRRIRQSFD
ncbi:MAG: DUF3422 domain-containing protein [Pseudomonadota bacterium]